MNLLLQQQRAPRDTDDASDALPESTITPSTLIQEGALRGVCAAHT